MRWVKLLFLAFGFYMLYATIKQVGLENILANLQNVEWKFIPLLFVYPVIFALDTLGWAYSFPKKLPQHIPFYDLYLIRIIGETLNALIPGTASLGGEPVKAQLLKSRHSVPLSDGYASLLIVHTTFWIALNFFVIGGILVTLKTLPLTPILWKSVVAFLVGLGLVALLLIIGLHYGIFQKVHDVGEIFKWWGKDSREKKLKFLALDGDIKAFYSANRSRFFLSSFFNFLGWFAGTIEVYLIFWMLDRPVSWTEAWLLEALIQVLRIVTFFIPSSIGAQEGGIVLIFQQFGFSNSVALTFAIIRRIREMMWIAVGLLLWSFLLDKPKIKKT